LGAFDARRRLGLALMLEFFDFLVAFLADFFSAFVAIFKSFFTWTWIKSLRTARCSESSRVFGLSNLFGYSSALNFVIAHYELLAIKALQVVDLRSPVNARHFGLYTKRTAALWAVFWWTPNHPSYSHFA
jgi:hypothetical protein